MQEIAGAKPLNFHVALPQPPVRPPVTMVAAGADAGSAGTATDGRASGDSRHPGSTPLPADPRSSRPDRFTLAGPSPAFQASILEVERDFRNVLARIQATRAKAEADVVFGTNARPAVKERAAPQPPAGVPETVWPAESLPGMEPVEAEAADEAVLRVAMTMKNVAVAA